MRQFQFRALAKYLNHWVRQVQQLSPSVRIGQEQITEVLFNTLFPDVTDYKLSSNKCIADGRSVTTQIYYERINDYDLEAILVTVVDEKDGTAVALSKMKDKNLLQGEEQLRKKIGDLYRRSVEEDKRSNRKAFFAFIGFIIVFCAFLAWIYFL